MRKYTSELTLLVIFIMLFAGMSILSPERFLSIDNMQSMAFQLPEFGIISLGMMTVILTGGINLSISSSAALSGIISAFVLTSSFTSQHVLLGILLSVVVCLLVALCCGLLNGFVVAHIGVPSILTTLGTMILFEGISLNLTKGGAVSGFPDAFQFIGNGTIAMIPVPILIFIVAIIVSKVLLENTRWGAQVYMAGCNPVATTFSGVNVKRVLLWVYIYSGLLSGLAYVIMSSRYNSAKVDYGSSYLLQSVAAVVLGGTSINGGHGKVLGTVLAVCIVQIVSSGLNILGINRNIVDITMGAILILVLTINALTHYYGRKRDIQLMKNVKRFQT